MYCSSAAKAKASALDAVLAAGAVAVSHPLGLDIPADEAAASHPIGLDIAAFADIVVEYVLSALVFTTH